MKTGRKSSNLVKSHELICHFIRAPSFSTALTANVVTKYLVKTHVITSEIISQKEYCPIAVKVKN